MEQFELFCRTLGWIVIGGCSLCILFSIIGLFYLLIKKIIMKSTDWDAIAKRHKKSQEAINYMAEHPLTHDEVVQQGIKLKNMSLEDEIKRYTEEKYHETFGNGQGTLDEFDWEDISTVIEDTAKHFYSLRPQPKQEWSEEDTEMYINVASSLRGYACGLENEEHKRHIKKGLDWLENRFKSLRPHPHWKPSDEQIRPLEYAIEYFKKKKNDVTYLESLYEDLQKLL